MKEIREKYKAYKQYTGIPYGHGIPCKKYPDDYVFDEEKSVRWNREEADRKNKEYRAEIFAKRNKKQAAWEDFIDSVLAYIKQKFNVEEELAGEIWAFCSGRAYTVEERLVLVEELVDLFGE